MGVVERGAREHEDEDEVCSTGAIRDTKCASRAFYNSTCTCQTKFGFGKFGRSTGLKYKHMHL